MVWSYVEHLYDLSYKYQHVCLIYIGWTIPTAYSIKQTHTSFSMRVILEQERVKVIISNLYSLFFVLAEMICYEFVGIGLCTL